MPKKMSNSKNTPIPLKEKRIPVVILRGGGDLASGVAARLHRVGIKIIITELAQPLAVRRLVSFCKAMYRHEIVVEGITAKVAPDTNSVVRTLAAHQIPVLVDAEMEIRNAPQLDVCALIDARMMKRPPELAPSGVPWKEYFSLMIGLGPGFFAGENCHVVIETNRGHYLGRAIWDGEPQADTGIPGAVASQRAERVLRSPADGILANYSEIGERVVVGQALASVDGQPIVAPFDGILRGLLHQGLEVRQGMKVGDVDPRDDPKNAFTISEKALAIGGGVLEALLTRPEIRAKLWN